MTRNQHEDVQPAAGAQDTRQGRLRPRILAVLVTAFVLTAIGFAIVMTFWMKPLASTNPNDGGQAVDAAAFKDEDRVPDASAPRTETGEPTYPGTGDAPNVNAPNVAIRPSNADASR